MNIKPNKMWTNKTWEDNTTYTEQLKEIIQELRGDIKNLQRGMNNMSDEINTLKKQNINCGCKCKNEKIVAAK